VYLWQEQQLSLPTPLPAVSPKERRQTAFSYRYYYNVCTMGYTSGCVVLLIPLLFLTRAQPFGTGRGGSARLTGWR
jgi:hypothetical protein